MQEQEYAEKKVLSLHGLRSAVCSLHGLRFGVTGEVLKRNAVGATGAE